MTARDPRTDPRPGDVVRLRAGSLPRTVLRVGQTDVFYLVGDLGENSMPLSAWKRWWKTATIIWRGPDD